MLRSLIRALFGIGKEPKVLNSADLVDRALLNGQELKSLKEHPNGGKEYEFHSSHMSSGVRGQVIDHQAGPQPNRQNGGQPQQVPVRPSDQRPGARPNGPRH